MSNTKRKTLAVVTPWRDHLELAPDYFAAVEEADPDQLIVVDDGSEHPLSFAAVRIEPSGFCTASNAGLAFVETDHVLFLNNDIQSIRSSWLESIRAAIEPGVVVGPLRDDRHGDVDGVRLTYVDGWCVGMTTEDARRIGGWDQVYDKAGSSYFSDNAFSFRARLNGMDLVEVIPGLRHKGGQTGGFGPQFQHAINTNRPIWEHQVREALR